MLCLWVNGHLNTAIREPSRILELHDRVKGMVAGAATNHGCANRIIKKGDYFSIDIGKVKDDTVGWIDD